MTRILNIWFCYGKVLWYPNYLKTISQEITRRNLREETFMFFLFFAEIPKSLFHEISWNGKFVKVYSCKISLCMNKIFRCNEISTVYSLSFIARLDTKCRNSIWSCSTTTLLNYVTNKHRCDGRFGRIIKESRNI